MFWEFGLGKAVSCWALGRKNFALNAYVGRQGESAEI